MFLVAAPTPEDEGDVDRATRGPVAADGGGRAGHTGLPEGSAEPRAAIPLGLGGRAAWRYDRTSLTSLEMAYLTREAGMAETTAAPTGGRALFVRQSSGLVREVSIRNALFYNTAAFIGITVAWAPLFYTLGFVPVGKTAGLTSYGWTAILVGAFCVFLGLIFASLATVMP